MVSKFEQDYADLERSFKKQVEQDRVYEADGQKIWESSVFLPNIRPQGKVDYLFVAMEPSMGKGAWSRNEVLAKIKLGNRNFSSSQEDFALHYAIQEYLCSGRETYYITDLSKGAMPGDQAKNRRKIRYKSWYCLFIKEMELVTKPTTTIITIGKTAKDFLDDRDFDDISGKKRYSIIHYSNQNGAARNKAIIGHDDQFGKFAKSIQIQKVVMNAELLITKNGLNMEIYGRVLSKLKKKELSPSLKKLIMGYSLKFSEIKIELSIT